MKIHLKTLIVAVALAALMFGAGRMVSVSRSWIDPVTASMKYESSFLIFPKSTEVSQSELERWIIRHEGAYKPQWKYLGGVSKTPLGRTYLCGRSPPIYLLDGRTIADFVRYSTDQEIANFVHIMRTGTQGEQEQAVGAAYMKAP